MKNEGYKKSRLVIQAFYYNNYGPLTHAPTVQRASLRLLLALSATDPSLQFFTRDISQAYTQSRTALHRPLGGNPLFPDVPVTTSLILESHLHHMTFVSCTNRAPRVLGIYSSDRNPREVICLQTDDTANAEIKTFVELKEVRSKSFQCKRAQVLTENGSVRFNGSDISLTNGISITAHWPDLHYR